MNDDEIATLRETFFDDFTDRDDLRHYFDKVLAEVRRLRGIIKSAETLGLPDNYVGETRNCPWCHYDAAGNWKRKHAPECPAFNENGNLR